MTSREKFEAWMTAEQWFHGSDFEWDERRNCYAQFGIHLAYKAFLAAEGAAEQKLTDMAVQLANAESKCRELVAKNAGMKNALEWLYETVSSESASIPDEKYSSVTNAEQVLSETSATDAFLAEVRAQGVDAAIEHLHKKLEGTGHIGVPVMALEWLAQELRKGAAL
ncbi:hypothetical protein ACTM7U_17785 [Citrobacter braakii]